MGKYVGFRLQKEASFIMRGKAVFPSQLLLVGKEFMTGTWSGH